MGKYSNAFFSETTNMIKAKLYMNVHWMVLYNLKVFCSDMKFKTVNNSWPLTRKVSCLKKIELRPLISGFDFALLEVRNLCVASRLI